MSLEHSMGLAPAKEQHLYRIERPISNEFITYLIHKGITHIYQGNVNTKTIPQDMVFLLHLQPKIAYDIELVPLLRVFFSHNSHLRPKEVELALTGVHEGWSNALLWGTLDMPSQKARERLANFDSLLRKRLEAPPFAHRYLTLMIKQASEKLIVTIRDQGWNRPFSCEETPSQNRNYYKGMSIIRNSCDLACFDNIHKTLRMEFQLLNGNVTEKANTFPL